METKKLQDLSFEARCGLIAKVIHSANRAYVDAIGGRPISPIWEEIREEQRQGLIKAVINMISDPQTPEITHAAWCAARQAEGWTKDIKYNYHRKTHPNLIPYAELPFEEQFRDHLFMGIASIFCSSLGMFHMPEDTKLRVVEDDEDENGMPLKEGGQEGPDQVINGVEKIYTPVMDSNDKEDEEPDQVINGVGTPTAKEILDQEPAEFTAADVAEAVFGGNPPDYTSPLPGSEGAPKPEGTAKEAAAEGHGPKDEQESAASEDSKDLKKEDEEPDNAKPKG